MSLERFVVKGVDGDVVHAVLVGLGAIFMSDDKVAVLNIAQGTREKE